ncbi:DUF554 domain-containing protein [Pseudoflavonifractor phocaeensis]|uniref:DUF554 domain-containing protein n=1 Tax=Pseudoflavonifractor phocaeensis TaxID=1870988 RepID=UPI001F3A4618|nr:DUF554 domain-containing protein [Pseudoflavonifractor phocaeensis]MCF2660817.1 DUF554 domain-containing protein [Pseudoflavonifractor phocaeensis]
MIGIGTIVNVAAIIVGGLIGLLFKGGLKEHYQEAIVKSLGLCTMFIGAAGALPGLLRVENGVLASAPIRDTLGMILSMALGTLIGEWLDFDGRMERLGAWLKAKASRGEDSQFIQGFVTASLTVCIGAMAIVGSIQDGLSHDPSTLFTKSILDFLIIIIFASTYGKGAIFSALPVGVLQGGVTLCAGLLAPVFSPAVISNLSFLGSILIFCVGVNLAFGSKFRVANMLPALVLGAAYTALL